MELYNLWMKRLIPVMVMMVFISFQFKMVSVHSEKPIPQCFIWNSSSVCLIDNGPLSPFQGKLSSASSFCTLYFQVIEGVMFLALYPQLRSPRHQPRAQSQEHQAPQHCRASKVQTACDGCFARQSVCLVIFLQSALSKAAHADDGVVKIVVMTFFACQSVCSVISPPCPGQYMQVMVWWRQWWWLSGSSAGGGDVTVQRVDEVDGVAAESKSKQSAGGSSVNDREEDADATQDPDSQFVIFNWSLWFYIKSLGVLCQLEFVISSWACYLLECSSLSLSV